MGYRVVKFRETERGRLSRGVCRDGSHCLIHTELQFGKMKEF